MTTDNGEKPNICGAFIDRNKLADACGTYYLYPQEPCQLPSGHEGLHKSTFGVWNAGWVDPSEKPRQWQWGNQHAY